MVEFLKPRLSYIICTSPRSGSWLLAEGLQATGAAGRPREWFHKVAETERSENWKIAHPEKNGYAEYMDRMIRAATTANGVFGLKLHWYQLQQLTKKFGTIEGFQSVPLLQALPQVFPNLKLIWLTRRNKIRQAISLHRARQTGTWWHPESYAQKRPVLGEASYDPVGIDGAERHLLANEAGWQRFFRDFQAKPMLVVYEDLVANYDETIRRALKFLELPQADQIAIAPTKMKSQTDGTTDDWLKRYLDYKQNRTYIQRSGMPAVIGADSQPLVANQTLAVANVGGTTSTAVAQAPAVSRLSPPDASRESAPNQQPSRAQTLLSVYHALAKLDPTRAQVKRVRSLAPTAFLRDYYAANRPVVLTEMMKSWKAMSCWTPDYLKQTLAGELVRVAGAPAAAAQNPAGATQQKEIPFEQFADQILSGSGGGKASFLAHSGFLKRPRVAPLLADIAVPEKLLNPQTLGESTSLAFEPGNFATPLRHEVVNVLFAQVYGRKSIKLVPSHELDLVYPGPNRISSVNPYHPDFTRHRKYQQATVIDIELEPGEMLFLPVGWWHAERALDANISLIFTNFVFPNQFARQPAAN